MSDSTQIIWDWLNKLSVSANSISGRGDTLPITVALLVIALVLYITSSNDKNGKMSGSDGTMKTYFTPKKELSGKDQLLIDMLDPQQNNFVITDPSLNDNPIIYASDAFCRFTKYDRNEIQGRNCRFLQGEGTAKGDITKIREAVTHCQDANVNLLNYKKDGTQFINQFFIAPLRCSSNTVQYYIGIQHEVKSRAPGQAPENVGWVYTLGSHE